LLPFDRNSKFGNDVMTAAKNLGTNPARTAFRSSWQNGVAERWVETCRDLLDLVIVLDERLPIRHNPSLGIGDYLGNPGS
jgi:hypothetical protein